MVEALAQKGAKLAKVRATDTMPEETETMEGQLAGLRCSYEGWISMVAQAAFLEQHPMMERDIEAGLEILGLVYEEPQRLLMAMEGNPFQTGALEMAMMWQPSKALGDDYTKLKGSQYLLKHQTPPRGPGEEAKCQQASSPIGEPSTPSQN